jgi:dihydropteroate synthase
LTGWTPGRPSGLMAPGLGAEAPPELLGCDLDLSRGVLMGVVNVTPDSFSDGGRHDDPEAAFRHAVGLAEAGADILDLGGESTRPGSDPVPAHEQLRRLRPVLTALRDHFGAGGPVLSVDTTSAEVAAEAIALGVRMVNDISAFTFDAAMLPLLAGTDVAGVAMHTTGPPKVMQQRCIAGDAVEVVRLYLQGRLGACEAAGVDPRRVVLDPGLGFGKTLPQNLALLRGIPALRALGRPLLVGASRKRFLGDLTGRGVDGRLMGTAAAVSIARFLGAHLLRVHDVAELRDVVRVADALTVGGEGA